MADTAVIAIIAGATTTLGVPFIGLYADRLRAERERRRDTAELRALLDEAAHALEEARIAVNDAQAAFLEDSESALGKAGKHFATAESTVRRLRTRLAIRLGAEDELTVRFDAAAQVLRRLERALLWQVDWGADRVETRAKSARQYLDTKPELEPAVEAFIEVARTRVGIL